LEAGSPFERYPHRGPEFCDTSERGSAIGTLRAKTIATRLTPEELQKVEAAVEGTMAHLFSLS